MAFCQNGDRGEAIPSLSIIYVLLVRDSRQEVMTLIMTCMMYDDQKSKSKWYSV
jgi:hypothetical protein